MVRIKKKRGTIQAIDDEKKEIELLLDSNVIHVQSTYPENRVSNAKRYRYSEKLEWETPSILTYLNRRVEIQLSDDVIDHIEFV